MAEYIANALQTVASNQDVLFTDTTVCSNNSIVHRPGSGIVTLRGLTNQCRARFKVTFGANIAIPTDGVVQPISVAIAISGESITSTNMIVTPAAIEQFFSVSRSIYIDVPAGCCSQISVKNTTTSSVNVENANLIVERVA